MSEQLFVRRIVPLLREKCFACHGDDVDSREGGLDLRSLQTVARGGDSEEPGVVPMHPDRSSVYLAVTRNDDAFSAMPPKESESLTSEEIGWLHDWIASGAKWPSKKDQTEIRAKHEAEWAQEDGVRVRTSGGLSDSWTNRNYDPEGLWVYQPLQEVAVPDTHENPIDGFLQAALPKGLQVRRLLLVVILSVGQPLISPVYRRHQKKRKTSSMIRVRTKRRFVMSLSGCLLRHTTVSVWRSTG